MQRDTILETIEEREQNIEDDFIFQNEEIMKQQPNDYASDKYDVKQCEYKLAFLLKGVFSYRRLTSSDTSFEQNSCSSKSKSSANSFFRKVVRFCTKKYNPRKKTHKAR